MSKNIKQKNSTFGYPCDTYPQRGIPELIDAIIKDYKKKYNVNLKPENIAVVGWTKEVLHNLARIYDKGNIVIPEPVYPAYEGATILSDHKIRRIPTSEKSGWLPKFNFKKDDVVFYFCDPNNPTGSVADKKYYKELAKKAKKSGVGGIFDKAYKDYVFDKNTKPLSITQFPELMNSCYEVVSFSKHYNFVGIGLGWIVSSKENIDRWLKFSGHFSQGVEWYKQKAGVEALTNPEVKKEIKNYMKELKERRDLFVKGLNKLGFEVKPPKATPYLWIKVPQKYKGNDEKFVLDVLLKEAHVAFMPGSYFGKSGKGYFRATIFISKDEIKQALKRIEEINLKKN